MKNALTEADYWRQIEALIRDDNRIIVRREFKSGSGWTYIVSRRGMGYIGRLKTAKGTRDFIIRAFKIDTVPFDTKRKKNPVPPLKRKQVSDAARLYEDFSGHPGETIARIEKPEYPDAVLAVGELDAVCYTTVRDGKEEKYIHEFRSKSRPLLCASHDGKQLVILGGDYHFTERGIVDK